MGNQVTTLGQIYPVEYYLADYCNDFTLDASLGSTRFMKVARVLHREAGYCVAKVYALNDPSIPIQEHKLRIEQIRDSIKQSGESSLSPFVCCLVNEKCAILLRQFIKYNLYDRLSTRPFLTPIEKIWIAYQLLRCVQSLHKQSIYHGDIKSENVLVTSFLWVSLSDFASYKPVTLPENNPSDFSYFFDTSRRHCCNIAPERFVEQPVASAEPEATEARPNYAMDTEISELTPQMDLFSLGCVLAELFSEDTPNSSMFDLGQILMFKKQEYDPSKFVEGSITDPKIRRLLMNLTDLDPSKRNSASYHLEQLVPSLFPAYFQTLHDYFDRLTSLDPDTRIMILHRDLDKLTEEIITEREDGLLLLLILATSTLRNLESIDAKLIGIRCCVRLIECSPIIMSEYVLDRLLPYIIYMLAASESRVRALCVSSLNRILKHVRELPASDSNVFLDYILPSLLPPTYDPSTLVRLTLAANISELAEISKSLLNSAEKDSRQKLNSLQESFGEIVAQLLVDPNGHVRRTFKKGNIQKPFHMRTSPSCLVEPYIYIRSTDAIIPNNIQSNSQPLLSSAVSIAKTTRPKGILLAHLHEHKGAVNKLIVVPGSSYFISCSSDSTIKFWDSTGVATKPHVLFRSKQTFISPDASPVSSISVCMGSDTLLALADNNNLHVLQLYSQSSHLRFLKTVNFSSETDETGLVAGLVSLSPYTYATYSTSSRIRGFDLRLPTSTDVWNLRLEGKDGLITCLDGNEYCVAAGTSSSILSLFDLRFYIRATSMSYPPHQGKMRRIRSICLCNDEIYCSVDGNNEVSTWNCESASRVKTLWHQSHNSVLSMIVGSNSVITAGDDMKIKFWDLNDPHRSYTVSKPITKNKFSSSASTVTTTTAAPTAGGAATTTTANSNSAATLEAMPLSSAHHDSIGCLASISSSNLLLSASRDGVIKLWR